VGTLRFGWQHARICQLKVRYTPDPFEPCGVVSLAGITDLCVYGATPGYCNDSVAALLGGTPHQVPERYAQTSPIDMLPFVAPQRILHGSLDAVVPLTQSQSFLQRARAAGNDVQLSLLDGAGHFDLIAPFSPAWLQVEKVVLELLGEPKVQSE